MKSLKAEGALLASHFFRSPEYHQWMGRSFEYLCILELGKGFAFVERQKRMIIDGEDFYLDLLFYPRS